MQRAGAEANLVEIFSSAQGEGPWVGVETVFVRFGGCDLRCAWCDSPGTWLPAADCRIELVPGSARFRSVPNPVALDTIDDALAVLAPASGGFVSLTGGEPLLQPEAVRAVAELARARGLRAYLETHGLALEALEAVLGAIDVVAMDWKLASDVAPAEQASAVDFDAVHAKFLASASAATQVFVKVVVTPNTLDEELDRVCDAITGVAPETLLVLQPVTPFAKVRERPNAERILAWQRRCAHRLDDVRVIPQTHRSYDAL
jgi:organic radical activating enzyme